MNAVPRPLTPDQSPRDDIATYDARDLISDGVQARVLLDGQSYLLRITRAGKLILTK